VSARSTADGPTTDGPTTDRPTTDRPAAIHGSVGHPVFLVRHAPTSWTGVRWCGRADPPLTDAGRTVAAEVGGRLAPYLGPTTTIRASPARRTWATAEAIASVGGVGAIERDEDLLEVDVGVVEGLSWADVERQFPELAVRFAAGERIDWPGGEPWQAVVERAGRAAVRVREAASRGTVIVVSHGGLLHALAGHLIASGGDPAIDPAAAPAHRIPMFEAGGILRIEPAPAAS
jgi:broad specificity phosphatase PhoE